LYIDISETFNITIEGFFISLMNIVTIQKIKIMKSQIELDKFNDDIGLFKCLGKLIKNHL